MKVTLSSQTHEKLAIADDTAHLEQADCQNICHNSLITGGLYEDYTAHLYQAALYIATAPYVTGKFMTK